MAGGISFGQLGHGTATPPALSVNRNPNEFGEGMDDASHSSKHSDIHRKKIRDSLKTAKMKTDAGDWRFCRFLINFKTNDANGFL